MIGNLFKKLGEKDLQIIQQWVKDHNADSSEKYGAAVMMWGVGEEVGKSKHYNDMWAILLQCK